MQRNPSPRSEFLSSADAVKAHHELIESPALAVALEVTMSEMQRRAAVGTDATNFNQCAASHLRMLGAQEFMDVLLNLAETEVAKPRQDNSNLPGNVATLPRGKN
jgi:hypothetical protein